MDISKLNYILPDQFSADALSDKIQSGINKTVSFIASLATATDSVDFDDETEEISLTEQEFVDIVSENYDGDFGTILSLQQGFTSKEEYSKQTYRGLVEYLSGRIDSIESYPIEVEDAAGGKRATTLGEAVSGLKDAVVSSTCEVAALSAMKQAGAADRVAAYEASIAQSSVDLVGKYSSTISSFKQFLIGQSDVRSMIRTLWDGSGSNEMESGEPIVLGEINVADFTGANPLSSLSFDTIGSAVVTIGSTVGKVCSGIFKAVCGAASWLWGKVSKGFTETFVNPYDVTDSGKETDGNCFSGFQFQRSVPDTGWDTFSMGTTDLSDPYAFLLSIFSNGDKEMQDRVLQYIDYNIVNPNRDKWYRIETIGGEMCYKIKVAHPDALTASEGLKWYMKYDYVFKPYPLRTDALPQRASYVYESAYGDPDGDGFDVDEYNQLLQSRVDPLYYDAKTSENELAQGFSNGTQLMEAVCKGMLNVSGIKFMAGSLGYQEDFIPYLFNKDGFSSGTVTNRDFLKLASGFKESANGVNDTFTYKYLSVGQSDSSREEFLAPKYAIISMICMELFKSQFWSNIQKEWKDKDYPGLPAGLGGDVFLPYTINKTGMSVGRYSIKTDAQNMDIANAIVTALIVVAIIVAAVTVGTIVIKKLARAAFWKRTEFVGRCDNAMWNGETLTKREKRKYIKYMRKLNASDMLTSGLSTGFSSVDGVVDKVSGSNSLSLDSITELIAGR